MSGTVPPPPPPGPGPQEPGGASSPAAASRRASAAPAAPPSFAPRGAGRRETTATPDEQATRPHAPVPPAPGASSPSTASPASPSPHAAQTTAWNATAPVAGSAPVPPQQAPSRVPAGMPPQQYGYGYTPQQYAYQQPSAAPGGTPPSGTTQQPSVGGRGRRLSAGWIAFIALDAVLLVVALVFAVGALGGSDLPDTQAEGTAEAAGEGAANGDGDGQDGAEQDADSGPGELVTEFASPSRNITCEVYADQVTCGLAERDQQPVPVEDCDGTSGYAVTLTGGGEVSLPCLAKGEKPKKAPKNMEQLPYGESRTEGDFTCTSETDGMYCQHDPSGNGFSLARAGVGTF
ncbi:hypothetical protein [Isoptericola sediminis]|uniref:Uncharacterized protein n=1 Tax=Isoptericola sediminis TaxID=2733572 RepID=A0A849KHI3_9MICO|nr:hypothetical protein [Isoptericola sediminis]NNU28073.1 hypothetical protein [Isoptericola sediminis]